MAVRGYLLLEKNGRRGSWRVAESLQERVGGCLPPLPPATDQVPPNGGGPRLGRLLRLQRPKPQIPLRQWTAGRWRTGISRRPSRRGRREWALCGHRAAQQRHRGQDGDKARLALCAVPARAGGVLRESILRSRRRSL